jgi:hypothetical protein
MLSAKVRMSMNGNVGIGMWALIAFVIACCWVVIGIAFGPYGFVYFGVGLITLFWISCSRNAAE